MPEAATGGKLSALRWPRQLRNDSTKGKRAGMAVHETRWQGVTLRSRARTLHFDTLGVESVALHKSEKRAWDNAQALSVKASDSTLLCARGVAPPAPHQSKQSSAHEQKAGWFRNNSVFDNRPTEPSRVVGAEEEAERGHHEQNGPTTQRI